MRNLIATPLRGELSRPLGSTGDFSDESLAKLQGVVSRFIQLSQPMTILPHITISSDSAGTTARNAAAAWSETAAEISSTEAALLPFVTHLAVARDDLDSLQFCIDADDYANVQSAKGTNMGTSVPGGVINCLDPASDRTPLHVAALNGAARCAHKLLGSGALVHCRDNLGHTPLYYVGPILSVRGKMTHLRSCRPRGRGIWRSYKHSFKPALDWVASTSKEVTLHWLYGRLRI